MRLLSEPLRFGDRLLDDGVVLEAERLLDDAAVLEVERLLDDAAVLEVLERPNLLADANDGSWRSASLASL